MSKFTDYIDGFADKTSTLAKEELKELISSAKKDKSEFVRMQAENVERWTEMLAVGELTPAGFKKQVAKLDILKKLETVQELPVSDAQTVLLMESVSSVADDDADETDARPVVIN